MKKIFKMTLLLGTISPLIASTGVVLASCSSHEQAPKQTIDWTDFKKAALNETAIEIVDSVQPPGWSGVSKDQLIISNLKYDDTVQTIKLDITRSRAGIYPTIASFEIDFTPGINYDIANWFCSSPPIAITSWTIFQKSAMQVTPAQILKVAAVKALANKIGWTDEDTAVFDTAGARTGGFIGMQGKPSINQKTYTIKTIISIERDKGLDADLNALPIIVTAVYDPTSPKLYNVSTSWANPEATPQLIDNLEYLYRIGNLVTPLIKNGVQGITAIETVKKLLDSNYDGYTNFTLNGAPTSDIDTNKYTIRTTLTIPNTKYGEDNIKVWLIVTQDNVNKDEQYGSGYSPEQDWSITTA